MNFPPFWAKGTCDDFSCWRWSHRSREEALALANEAAQKLADRFRAGDIPTHGYGYPDRPLREPVLREIKNGAGEAVAVVTRNSYGSLVLNTARVMFVDVDLPEPNPSGGLLKRLFGKPDVRPAADPANDAIARTEMWARKNPDWGWRIYRTRAGLLVKEIAHRVGFTDPPYFSRAFHKFHGCSPNDARGTDLAKAVVGRAYPSRTSSGS